MLRWMLRSFWKCDQGTPRDTEKTGSDNSETYDQELIPGKEEDDITVESWSEWMQRTTMLVEPQFRNVALDDW